MSMSEQPAPVLQPGSQPVLPIAQALFLFILSEQDRKGTSKYGVGLHTHNGRRATIDAMQECVDLFHYLAQKWMEEENPEGEISDNVAELFSRYAGEESITLPITAPLTSDAGVGLGYGFHWKLTQIQKMVDLLGQRNFALGLATTALVIWGLNLYLQFRGWPW